jgi:hypothetical protein
MRAGAVVLGLSAILLVGCLQPTGPVCAEGWSRCGDTCRELDTDATSCGACGRHCNPGQACAGGTCSAALYVDAARPDDAGDGRTPATAKRTIQAAIAAARPPATLLVAEGDYTGSSQAGTEVRLRSGVSLLGGHDRTFQDRNPATRITRIRDTSTTGGDSLVPNRAVTVPDGVAEGTLLDGFVIQGGTGLTNAAVVTLGSAAVTISRNWIIGGDACTNTWGCRSVGLHLESPATVLANSIEAGSGLYAIGIWNYGGSPLVASNVISGSATGAAAFSFGLYSVSGSPRLLANTIDGGRAGNYAYALVGDAGAPVIENNLLFTTAAPTGRICLADGAGQFRPASLRNNAFFDCPSAVYSAPAPISGQGNCPFWSDGSCFTTASALNDPVTTGAGLVGGNLTLAAVFTDRSGGDYHLGAGTPTAVTTGGRDLSALVAIDRDGATRAAPWSMGAYQAMASAACPAGMADCDGEGANGCETSIATSVAHCGSCGNACPEVAGAAPVCQAGRCGASVCLVGLGDCDGFPGNGCETALDTSILHCGACGHSCAAANAVPSCQGGACAIAGCFPGWGDCDGAVSNGCEAPFATSGENCGGCGRACGATQACRGGACVGAGGSWVDAGTPVFVQRGAPTLTPLPSGRLLLTGHDAPTAEAEVWNPAARAWRATGLQVRARNHASATLLPSGQVLLAGGATTDLITDASAELYDPATDTWSPTGAMHAPRGGHGAFALSSGKVLVFGGWNYQDLPANLNGMASVELFDPATGTWALAAPAPLPLLFFTSAVLADGRVLVVIGQSSLLYDPVLDAWSWSGTLLGDHWQGTATLLPSGLVLVVGSARYTEGTAAELLYSAELFDPSTGTWSAAAPLPSGRAAHTATLLPSGFVLVAGGEWPVGAALATAELYDVAGDRWLPAARLRASRGYQAAALVPGPGSGAAQVLVTGGNSFGSGYLSTAELFTE